jgi:hypothetical protein
MIYQTRCVAIESFAGRKVGNKLILLNKFIPEAQKPAALSKLFCPAGARKMGADAFFITRLLCLRHNGSMSKHNVGRMS